jgi:xylulokinase
VDTLSDGREVATVRAEEGAAYGAAILAGVGAGAWPTVDAACEAVVSVADRLKHDAESAALLDKQYARFRMIYPALRAVS